MGDVVVIMNQNINIAPSKKGDTFIVSYEAAYPKKVGRVTNALASGFIEENIKYREEKAAEVEPAP